MRTLNRCQLHSRKKIDPSSVRSANSCIYADLLRGFSISSFMILPMSLVGEGVSVGVHDL